MKKTLTLSLLAATIFGGMIITAPAEAHDWHHEWRHAPYASNYNPYYGNAFYGNAYYGNSYGGYPAPVWHRVRTGWFR